MYHQMSAAPSREGWSTIESLSCPYSPVIAAMPIVSIAWKPADVESRPAERYARVAVEAAELITGKGIAGDRKGNGRERHLNVMARETLDRLQGEGCKTGPGEMGEQIVLAGIDVDRLPAGTRLRLGTEA